jgi:hypothetical protein
MTHFHWSLNRPHHLGNIIHPPDAGITALLPLHSAVDQEAGARRFRKFGGKRTQPLRGLNLTSGLIRFLSDCIPLARRHEVIRVKRFWSMIRRRYFAQLK